MSVRDPRLVIAKRPTRRDHLHGAWWPYTTDIERELTPMLMAVAARFPVVLGVMLNRDEWADTPLSRHPARVGKAKISWYGLPEQHLVVLHCGDTRRIALLVLPPETPEWIALTATLMATAPGNALTTDETLARARVPVSPAQSR